MVHGSKTLGFSASGNWFRGRHACTSLALGRAALLLFLCVLWEVGQKPSFGQEKPNSKLLFLVARRSIQDPIFERSVVLMIPLSGEPLIVGLIVNKPTHVPVLKLFPQSAALRDGSEIAYMGGPVDLATPALVFHAPKAPKQAMLLYGDVYLSFDPKFIAKRLQDPKPGGDLRLILGRAQWAPEQLQGEALEGSWYSLRAEGEVIFDRDSDHLWKRLHDRARPSSSVENRAPEIPQTRAGL